MTWAILGPYLIGLGFIMFLGNFVVAMTVDSEYVGHYPYRTLDTSKQRKWHARVSLAAIAWPLVIPVALLYAIVRTPGWMVRLVRTADLPPLRVKETK